MIICANLWIKSQTTDVFYRPQIVLFYLTRPLLLGEAPQPLLNPPLLRSGGLKAWPAGPVRANKLSPLKGLLVITYATELRLFDAHSAIIYAPRARLTQWVYRPQIGTD